MNAGEIVESGGRSGGGGVRERCYVPEFIGDRGGKSTGRVVRSGGLLPRSVSDGQWPVIGIVCVFTRAAAGIAQRHQIELGVVDRSDRQSTRLGKSGAAVGSRVGKRHRRGE